MSRHQFRLLVVLNQLLHLGGYFVQHLTDLFLPPELQEFLGVETSVLEGGMGGAFYSGELLYLFSLVLSLATLIAALGLCLERAWGRRLYLTSFILSLPTIPLTPFYANTGWTVLVGTLYATTEGMILALIYFSHLKRLFEREVHSDEEAD